MEEYEILALASTANRYTADHSLTAGGLATGTVKGPFKRKGGRGQQSDEKAPADAVFCMTVQGKPGAPRKHWLSGTEKRFHAGRMDKVKQMNAHGTGGKKPNCHPICGRHFFMISQDRAGEHGYGKNLRWQGNGKAPWGKEIYMVPHDDGEVVFGA